MTNEAVDLIKKIGQSAKNSDHPTLRDHWRELHDRLRAGHPLRDHESFELVKAIDESGVLDHLANDGSGPAKDAVKTIAAACQSNDADARGKAVQNLLGLLGGTGAQLSRPDAVAVLKDLMRVRDYEHAALLAERLIARGIDLPTIRRIYAQALIERKQIVAATQLLEGLAANPATPADVKAEAIGLIGRANKQLFIDGSEDKTPAPVRQESLRRAIEAYRKGVNSQDLQATHWPAVNLIALVKRAGREGIVVPGRDEADRLAERIVAEVKDSDGDPWTEASLGEAYLALGNVEEAARWFGRYAKQGDAFMLASTIRQLEEVWQLKVDGSPEGEMLAALKTSLLRKPGGQIGITAQESKHFAVSSSLPGSPVTQSILGADGPIRIEWVRQGLVRAQGIGRIVRGPGLAEGTGFLVDPNDLLAKRGGLLGSRRANELVLLTNYHLVNKTGALGAMRPEEAVVEFEMTGADGASSHQCRWLWESPLDDLDATLLRLDPPVRLGGAYTACPLADDETLKSLRCADAAAADGGAPSKPSNVYVIGHAEGQSMSISLHDATLLDKGQRPGKSIQLFHYRTPTLPGNSGSPVFNEADWQVVALHHAGGDGKPIRTLSDPNKRHIANEGISIGSIRAKIRRDQVRLA